MGVNRYPLNINPGYEPAADMKCSLQCGRGTAAGTACAKSSQQLAASATPSQVSQSEFSGENFTSHSMYPGVPEDRNHRPPVSKNNDNTTRQKTQLTTYSQKIFHRQSLTSMIGIFYTTIH